MKKKWSDYLWIASLTYLILGFFNILFAWLGLICFIVPIVISLVTGSKWAWPALCSAGPQITSVRLPPCPRMAQLQGIPLRIPGLFYGHVRADAFQHRAGL